MEIDDIQSWPFTAAEAASILGWDERQFASWTKRYSPFPHKKAGRGRSISYDVRDIMKLSAIGHLVALGLTPEKAFAAYAPYGGPYIFLFRHGESTFIQDVAGKWTGADSTEAAVAIKVRAWPIFRQIFPRVRTAILANPRNQPIAELEKTIEEFKTEIERLGGGKKTGKRSRRSAEPASLAGSNNNVSTKGRLSGGRVHGSPK